MQTDSSQLVSAAGQATPALTPEQAAALAGDADVQLVDVREPAEVAQGSIAGAVHVPRGVLEFRADPASSMHLPALASGKRLVLFCASGGRAALAAQTLQGMGVARVEHVTGGGFAAMQAAGAPVG